jgi:uncharacterized membrane protein
VIYNLLKLLHVLSIIVWIGGMIYTLFFLRPSLGSLEPPQRVKVMHDVLGRFFKAVLIVSTVAVVSGLWMIGRVARETVQAGGTFTWPMSWIVMTALGLLMFAIFGHIRFALYKRLQRAVVANDWPAGGKALEQIRTWVSINLAIGIAIIAVVFLVR